MLQEGGGITSLVLGFTSRLLLQDLAEALGDILLPAPPPEEAAFAGCDCHCNVDLGYLTANIRKFPQAPEVPEWPGKLNWTIGPGRIDTRVVCTFTGAAQQSVSEHFLTAGVLSGWGLRGLVAL